MSEAALPSDRLDLSNRSPWLDPVRKEPLARRLRHPLRTDVVVVGAGIAGVATAFFLLRDTQARVTLIEASRVAHGATGYNAGQLVTYFERPLCRLAETFGPEKAIAAQRDVDESWRLLDLLLSESAFPHGVPRVAGQMGMFTLDHLAVHLRNNLLRRTGGLVREAIRISERAGFLRDVPREFDGLYEVVPQDRIHALLATEDPRYLAALSDVKGCMNGALLCEHLVDHLLRNFPGRFELYEHSPVERVELEREGTRLRAAGHEVRASRVVLCTNAFVDLELANAAGAEIRMPALLQRTIGFMAAYFEPEPMPPSANSYLMSPRINEGQAYFYVTRRPFETDGRSATLTCIGGPDALVAPGQAYDRDARFPASELAKLESHIAPVLGWSPGSRRYDYLFHGLMAYTPTQTRVIGAEPRNPVLLYNLGCNGVGLLPSIHGGWRIAQTLGGTRFPASLFDPV